MNKKEMFIEAHKMTKELKIEFPNIDYKFQFGLCLAYLKEEGENKMVELKGSEKQVKWANDIRKSMIKGIEYAINEIEKVQNERVESGSKRLKMYDKKIRRAEDLKEALLNVTKAEFFIYNFKGLANVEPKELNYRFQNVEDKEIEEINNYLSKQK